MARRLTGPLSNHRPRPQLIRGFLAAVALPLAVAAAVADPSPAPTASPSPASSPDPTAKASPSASPAKLDEWIAAHQVFEQMSPDAQKKFLDNLEQWRAMSPEEQELYRDREIFRNQHIGQEINDAITKSGLKLDDDEREVFALRYTQERRKIEESLHKEIDAQRQAMITDMLARLKAEFSGTPAVYTERPMPVPSP
jgi:hypothetical protein